MAGDTAAARTVAVYGAGIAGLTVAHELARRGWQVTVFEENLDAGGFFRSARRPEDAGVPSEYSWHGMGPWYHNVFDILKQVPFDRHGSVHDRALSRPIDFGVAPDRGDAQFDDSGAFPDIGRMFRMTRLDTLRWAWLMLKTWTANRRSHEAYAALNAAGEFRKVLSPLGCATWVACFGPWVGSDWTRVSLHQAGLFFRRQLFTRPIHHHQADDEGPAWRHGPRSGWLLLRGPSSEAWFDRWVAYLGSIGVRFRFGHALQRLDFDGSRIIAAEVGRTAEAIAASRARGEAATPADARVGQAAGSPLRVHADVHVLAANPFATADLLELTPGLACVSPLSWFRPLVQDGPHTQVSFRLVFDEPIRWPRPRCAVVVADSEFDITLFAQEQAWLPTVDLGEGVGALWTATACVASVPGRVHGLPLEQCTREQFIDEVREQILRCDGLDRLVRAANGGRPLASFAIRRIEVWHEWMFAGSGIVPRQPKWVTTTRTQPWQPPQRTPLPNLVLAGAHTRTDADVWSIEAAVESGRRAARVFEPGVVLLPQHRPAILRVLGALDDALYRRGAPHVLVVLPVALLAGAALLLAWQRRRRRAIAGHGGPPRQG